MAKTPAAILYDSGGTEKATSGNPLRTDPTGSTTQPVSASSLPLPTGAATETTLASADTKLGTIDSVLDSIKDTDGIKKITDALPTGDNTIGRAKVTDGTEILEIDASGRAAVQDSPNIDVALSTRALESGGNLATVATKTTSLDLNFGAQGDSEASTDTGSFSLLSFVKRLMSKFTTQFPAALTGSGNFKTAMQESIPAGTNEIGKVAQGTKAAGSGAWPTVLYDASGNAVGIVLDGAVYRIQVDSKVAKDEAGTSLVHLQTVDAGSGIGRLKATLYTQDDVPIAFGSATPDPAAINNEFVMNGGSSDLRVNGSVTPVVFTYNADSTYDISLEEIKFVLAANGITFGTDYFGATSGPLTNGLLIEITADSTTGTVGVLKQNENFVFFSSPGGFEWVVSSKDMMSATYQLGGGLKLRAGSGDNVKVTVRDNISSCGVYFRCFVKGNLLPG